MKKIKTNVVFNGVNIETEQAVPDILNEYSNSNEDTYSSAYINANIIPPEVDSELSLSSENPVQNKVITQAIDSIEEKIPEQASSSNQLADKDFVNSSINNLAAFYITSNIDGDPFPTKIALDEASVFYSGGEIRVPTRNDYCIVIADEDQATPVSGYDEFTTTAQYVGFHVIYDSEDIVVTNENKDSLDIIPGTTLCYEFLPTTRYSYQGDQWEFQYVINDTSLTAAQLAAINSGITSAGVSKLNGIEAGAEVNVQSDWDENNSLNDDYVKNRPVIHTQGRYIEDNTVKTSNGSMAQTGTTTSEDGGWVQPQAEGRGSAAFGRGTVAGGQEDWSNPDANNHDYAFASGKNAKAYGDSSFAANRGTKVTGANAAAFNESTEAQGKDSFACGYGSKAYSKGAFASGYYTEANGEYSFTANSSDTNGKYAFAAGEETRATNEAATSFGRSTQATGENSMATGHSTFAQHIASFTAGRNTQTSKENQMVVGQYNADDNSALFIVGDGTADNARSNCFEAGSDGNGNFIKVGNTRVNESEIRSINGMSGGTLTSQLVITGGDASSDAKIAMSNAGSGQITDETTHTLFGFTADNTDTLTVGHNNYKTNIRGSGTRPQYKGEDLALYSDTSGKLDKDTSTSGDARLYGINANGTQAIFTLDYSNTASAGRVPRRSSSGALMINDNTYDNPGQFNDGLQAVNKNKLIEMTTAKTGSSAPTTATVGYVGQLYRDTTNNKLYICDTITEDTSTNPSTFTYTWTQVVRITDVATLSSLGVVKPNKAMGTSIDGSGNLSVEVANASEISSRSSQSKVIYTGNLNNAVKAALSDTNHLTMTTAEQATARSVLGISSAGTAIESHTISSWTSLSSSSPYTYQATITAAETIGNDTIVELINDQAVLFATYGFAIGSISGQDITIYSIGQPTSSVTLKVGFGG